VLGIASCSCRGCISTGSKECCCIHSVGQHPQLRAPPAMPSIGTAIWVPACYPCSLLTPLQVQLQQARGPFQLTETFSEVVQIPLDRLRGASPYASHRASLSPTSPVAKSSPGAGPCTEGEEPVPAPEPGSPQSHSTCSEVPSAAVWAQADSGHGSESDTAPHSAAPSEAGWQDVGLEDLESASWATAVALAWLEHRCAGFFDEWELVAAKADAWLQAQQLPEGLDVSCLKGAARHLFLLLRHWDENITLNMLCYNPNNV